LIYRYFKKISHQAFNYDIKVDDFDFLREVNNSMQTGLLILKEEYRNKITGIHVELNHANVNF